METNQSLTSSRNKENTEVLAILLDVTKNNLINVLPMGLKQEL